MAATCIRSIPIRDATNGNLSGCRCYDRRQLQSCFGMEYPVLPYTPLKKGGRHMQELRQN